LGKQFWIQPIQNVHTFTTGTPLTLGSVFISGIIVGSLSSSFMLMTLSASIPVTSFPTRVDITSVSLVERSSPLSKSMLLCKTTTLITAVPSHYMNQGSIRTILLSIKMLTPTYRFTLLKLSNSRKSSFFFQYTSNCCSISHPLTCLLHNLKRHFHIQRSFLNLPIRGQRNPVYTSHSIYLILTSKISPDVDTAKQYICLTSLI